MMKHILFCFGTRPEVIKMAPVIHEARKNGFKASVCLTGQHKEMIIPFLDFFEITEDYSLNIMKKNQSLASLNASILSQMDEIIELSSPDYIAVQGDTSSTFACALAGFFRKLPIIHIEAGLRTHDIYSPFPEEVNRQMVSTFSSYNFCPTEMSKENLIKEHRKNIFVTGNTSIDALRITMDKIKNSNLDTQLETKYKQINFSKPIVLVTSHRRENHGKPLQDICRSLKEIAQTHDCQIVYPVHLNPNVKDIVKKELSGIDNIILLEPLQYLDFSWFMSRSFLILTDSGGVQEEGPYFKKPIIVLRENTERPEVVAINAAKLVGSDSKLITSTVDKCFKDKEYYDSFSQNESPYGEGYASREIINKLRES